MFDLRRTRSAALAVFLVAACGTDPGATTEEPEVGTDIGSSDPGTNDVSTEDVTAADAAPADAQPSDATPEPDALVPIDTGTIPDALPPRDVPPEPDLPVDELEEACVSACEDREDPNGGGCPLSLEVECADWCVETGPNVQPELLDAYFECISVDPLCFQTILQCAIGLTYPEPFAHTVTLRGTGYDAWDGESVIGAVEVSAGEFPPATGIVQEGAFELTFDVVMGVNQSHLTLFYIDANQNGSCDPDADETGSGSVELWGLPDDFIEVPEWLIEVPQNPETDMGFVCDFIE